MRKYLKKGIDATVDNKNNEYYVYYLVAKNLKIQRKLKGLTQSQFAELCNYSEGFIMNIESEKYYQTFSLGTLWNFSKVLDVDIRVFFNPIEEDKKKD